MKKGTYPKRLNRNVAEQLLVWIRQYLMTGGIFRGRVGDIIEQLRCVPELSCALSRPPWLLLLTRPSIGKLLRILSAEMPCDVAEHRSAARRDWVIVASIEPVILVNPGHSGSEMTHE